MGVEDVMVHVILCLYAVCVIFYLLDFLHRSQQRSRRALWMLCAVWILQAGFLFIRFIERDFVPVFTVYDAFQFFAWVLMTFAIGIHVWTRARVLVLIANAVGLLIVASGLFVTADISHSLNEQFISGVLFIHVTLALIAYALFLLSFLLAALYLIVNDMLKKKRLNLLVRYAPSLNSLKKWMVWGSGIGVGFLLLSLVLGLIWANEHIVSGVWFDPKIWLSFLVLFVYSYFVYRGTRANWSGKSLAWCNAIAYTTVLLNLFMSDVYASFHHW